MQAKAILELKQWLDLRDICMKAAVPVGSGKTVNTQVITAPSYDSWTEGSALAAADPTLVSKSITLTPFGKVTQISDLLANTSAINFVEAIGQVHGACVRQGILDKIVDAIAGATSPNSKSIGTKGDVTEASFTLANVIDCIKENQADGWMPDYILTAPDKMWYAFTTDYTVSQFHGALADLLVKGEVPMALGLKWLVDPYFELAINAGSAWSGVDGEKYAIVGTKGISSIWAALQDDPLVEIYRVPTELSNYVVTHIDGGADEGPVNSICIVKHAA
ncbi:hypothetical protein MUP01_04740 [Candidatus Bathyarchaeota archaeon]|nr:hypothetical protein [Candidatus Bathyarchaeota archaeon]